MEAVKYDFESDYVTPMDCKLNKTAGKNESDIFEQLPQVQEHCLKIAKAIDDICVKNGIEYSITGGTVIGYHLYGGFIPWDDDVDLMMTRENYDRFLCVAEKELPQGMKLKNFKNGLCKRMLFSKVYDENTTIVEKTYYGGDVVDGIFVDITVMDRIPKNLFFRTRSMLVAKLAHLCQDIRFEKPQSLMELIQNWARSIMRPFSVIYFTHTENVLRKNKCHKEYDYAEVLQGFPIMYKRELFETFDRVMFDGVELSCVHNYMDYLETRYGRREFTRQYNREMPNHLLYVNCNMAYKDYLMNS